MRNIAFKLRYDGTNYHGWQAQRTQATVSETLEAAVTRIVGHPAKFIGCGRTDAGVHALTYVANFRTDSRIPVERLPIAVNSWLPDDVVVLEAAEVKWEFNAISSCQKKEYTYKIYNAPLRDPFYANKAYHYPRPLDLDAMKAAASMFPGTKDFAAVRSESSTNVKSTIRTVFYFEVMKNDDIIELKICADGFLYNMARSMAGTVIYASEGKIAPGDIQALLERGDRRLMGPTLPPGGLYMTKLWYGGEVEFN